MPAGIYSARNTSFIYGGLPAIGLADDNAFEIAWDDDAYTFTVGMDDFVVASETGSSIATATLRILTTSPYNDYLQASLTAQKVSSATAFKPFLFADLLGTLKVTSAQALIVKTATITTSKDVPVREWTIKITNPVVTG